MNIFFNSQELRLRAFWRILIINGAILFSMILVQGLFSFDNSLFPIISAVLVFAIIASLGSRLDKRKVSDYGLAAKRIHLFDTVYGVLTAILIMAILFIVSLSFSWISVKDHLFAEGFLSTNRLANHLAYLAIMIAVGFYEEWWNRGYLLLNLKEGFEREACEEEQRNLIHAKISTPIIAAALLSSAFFSFLHLGNPNMSTLATVNIFLAGIMLSLPFILTGRLGFSIGLHIGWNYAQGGIFGWAVSGTQTKGNLIAIEQIASFDYINGGAFGPEGGVLGTVGIALVVVASLVWVRKRFEV
jgi:membrane protease YdiL (CAAX protease family)